MNEQYRLHLNNFKNHLEQLKLCKSKVLDRNEKVIKLNSKYLNYLSPIISSTQALYTSFKNEIENLSLEKINEVTSEIANIRKNNDFYVNQYDILSSGEGDTKKEIKSEISKINFLVEASVKLKIFINDRYAKIIEKFSTEDNDELLAIKNESCLVADTINLTASVTNAKITFAFSAEIELSGKLQALETITSELTKRFSSLN